MKKSRAVCFILVLCAGHVFAGSFSIQAKASYFLPADSYFKSIYGNAPTFGAKIGLDIWKGLGVWVDAEFYSKKGKTSLSGEETELQLFPLAAGIRCMFLRSRSFSPYLGAGIGYFQYKEVNPIGTVSKSDTGFVAQAGFMLKLGRTFFFDIQGSFSNCKVNPAGVEADLGGWKAGLGLGISF